MTTFLFVIKNTTNGFITNTQDNLPNKYFLGNTAISSQALTGIQVLGKVQRPWKGVPTIFRTSALLFTDVKMKIWSILQGNLQK